MYKNYYITPKKFDNIWLFSDGTVLRGLCFEKSNDEKKHNLNCETKNLKIFEETKNWLDIYFSGNIPSFTPPYIIFNTTKFRHDVYEILLTIPYGMKLAYSDISKILAKKYNNSNNYNRAVGNAVKSNPIALIIPCHRVIGKNNDIVGYNGGINNKIALLNLEQSKDKNK